MGCLGLLLQPLVSAPYANQYSTNSANPYWTHLNKSKCLGDRQEVPYSMPGGFLSAFNSSYQLTDSNSRDDSTNVASMHSIGATIAALRWKDRPYGVVKSVGMALF